MQKTQYIEDLELATQAWGLRGEEPVLYHIMRVVAPRTIRQFSVAIENVVSYGTEAIERAKARKLQRQNVLNMPVKDLIKSVEIGESPQSVALSQYLTGTVLLGLCRCKKRVAEI